MVKLGKGAEAVAAAGPLALGREPPARSQGMDRLRDFLDAVKDRGLAAGNFMGLLHILIGRKIMLEDGTVVSNGQTWREAAALLKRVRWERESVAELGLDPEVLPPRDRQLYWFKAIAQAKVDSLPAKEAGDRLGQALKAAGFIIGPAPHA